MRRCLNCLRDIPDGTTVCPYCGAHCDDGEGYVLLTADGVITKEEETDNKKEKRKNIFRVIVAVLLTIALITSGLYFFVVKPNETPDKPELSFTQGTGIINENQKVVYVKIADSSKIKYIHGVNLYKGDVTSKHMIKDDPITDKYEYTKNVDDSFRTIFFYADDLNIKSGTDYTYTFSMNFQFLNDSKIYNYRVPVTFSGDIKKDASSDVFDHSVKDEQKEEQLANEVVSDEKQDKTYIYDGYWFTEPISDKNNQEITAIKFDKDGKSCVYTTYSKKEGDGGWNVKRQSGTYSIKNNVLKFDKEKTSYALDSRNKTLESTDDSNTAKVLTNRKYNSVANVNDFFA